MNSNLKIDNENNIEDKDSPSPTNFINENM